MNNHDDLGFREELLKIARFDTNKMCFDCFSEPAYFASVSEGIFLCLKCSSEHRDYVNPKTIKSITLDEWTSEEIKSMIFGGNRNLRKFINANPIPNGKSIKDVFTSKIMNIYRKKLKASVRNEKYVTPYIEDNEKYELYIENNNLKTLQLKSIEDSNEENEKMEDDELYKPNKGGDKLFFEEYKYYNPLGINKKKVHEYHFKNDIEYSNLNYYKKKKINNDNNIENNHSYKILLYKITTSLLDYAYTGISFSYNYIKSFFVSNNNNNNDGNYMYDEYNLDINMNNNKCGNETLIDKNEKI